MYSSQYRGAGQAKEIKRNENSSECCMPRKSLHMQF
jgi:hypothetical protein